MTIDYTTLAIAKNFAKGLALGGYTQVTAIENQVKFTMADGTPVTVTLPIPKDGVSVINIEIIDGNLICTLSDGTKINCGEFPSGVLSEKLVVSNPVGSATMGKVYNSGTTFETLLRDILIKEETPTLTISLTPNKTLYDVVDETLDEVIIKSVVGKKTYPIKDIKVYIDDVLVSTLTENVEDGGIFNYTHIYNPSINKDTIIKVVVTDIRDLYVMKTQTIKFVGKSYYGYVESTVGEPTESEIKVLQHNILKDVKGFVYKNISFDYNKVVYAYPKNFGELSSIKDIESNINYTNSFTKNFVTIDEMDYIYYIQNDASQSIGINITFA
jgi:hypothetical protein